MKYIHEDKSRKKVRAEIARNISMSFNNIVLYTHSFFSEVVNTFRFILHSVVCCEPNDVLLGYWWPFRDCKGRALCRAYGRQQVKLISSKKAMSTTRLVARKDIIIFSTTQPASLVTDIFPLRPLQRAIEGLIFKPTEEAMKIFIAQKTCRSTCFKTGDQVPYKVRQEVIGFPEKSIILLPTFSIVCLQAINGKKQ